MKNSLILSFILFLPFCISAQCDDLNNHPDGKEAALKLFVYRDFVKAKDYEQAFPIWEELYKCCKAGNGNILKDGITMYHSFAENTLDDEKKQEFYLKSAQLMEERASCYGYKIRKKTGLLYYGFRYYQIGKHYYKHLDDYEKAAYYFEKSIEADSVFIESNLIGYYIYISRKRFKKEELTADSVDIIAERLMKTCNADTVRFKKAKEKLKDEIYKIHIGRADCNYIVRIIKRTYDKNKHDDEYLMSAIKDLKRFRCDDNHPFLLQVIDDYKSIPEHRKPVRKTLSVQEMKVEFAKGIANDSIPAEKRYKAAMRLGRLHQQDKEWEQALKFYNKAKELNPNSGEPYISIGMLYLSANKTCDGFERQLIANAALDQFRVARKYEDAREDAKEKIATYSEYLPMRKYIEIRPAYEIGQEVTVGCVLEVKTVVRAKD